jgi:CBS domain-containing protein
MKASDIMVTDVPTISQKSPVSEAVRLLKQNFGDASFLNAAPGLIVVNGRGELAGILSPLSIITALLENAHELELPSRLNDEFFARLCDGIKHKQVEEVMERQAISVTEDALLTDVAELFVKHRFQRVPVVTGKKVVGIIYRSRLLFAMAKSLLQ